MEKGFEVIDNLFNIYRKDNKKGIDYFAQLGHNAIYDLLKVNPEHGIESIEEKIILKNRIKLMSHSFNFQIFIISFLLSIIFDSQNSRFGYTNITLILLFHMGLYFVINFFNSKNKKKTLDTPENNTNNVLTIKRNNNLTNANVEDILIGDVLRLSQGTMSFDGILVKGEIRLFEPDINGKMIKKLKSFADPFIIQGSMILECDAEMIVCSLEKIYSQKFMEKTFNSLNIQFGQKESEKDELIKVPENYIVSDPDIKSLIEIFNDDSTSWVIVVNETNVVTEAKHFDTNLPIFRTVATIESSPEMIIQAITDPKIRIEWDKNFDQLVIVDKNREYELLYMVMKSPSSFISARDLLQQRKVLLNFPNDNSTIIHNKSVVDEKYPPVKNLVRANTIISGYYIEKLDEKKCRIAIVSQTDIGGSIPMAIFKPIVSKAPKDWIKNLNKYLV